VDVKGGGNFPYFTFIFFSLHMYARTQSFDFRLCFVFLKLACVSNRVSIKFVKTADDDSERCRHT
jgi:hypothetical protein